MVSGLWASLQTCTLRKPSAFLKTDWAISAVNGSVRATRRGRTLHAPMTPLPPSMATSEQDWSRRREVIGCRRRLSCSRFRHLPPSSDPQNSSEAQQRTGAVALPASKRRFYRQPFNWTPILPVLVRRANSRVNITFGHQSELRICLEMNYSGTFYSDVAWETLQTVIKLGRDTCTNRSVWICCIASVSP